MSINSTENAIRYSEELDRLFAGKSATGFFADNALRAKFVGAKTVIIPDIDFQGLADYDRDTGFARGAITVSNTSHTMTMDRARSLQIDREDMDETGIANLAGSILGEYVRTKVVPECDAYVLSKLATVASTRGNTVLGEVDAPLATLCELIQAVQNNVGYDEELVAFIDSRVYAKLQNSSELSKMLIVNDFKQGDISLKVNTFNGVAIIPVVSSRMNVEYTFNNDAEGGFAPINGSRQTYMLVCPKRGAHLVKKTEQMRIFSPEQNLDADAYKFDYRIYYDVFVNKSGLDNVWAWISPEIQINGQPRDFSGSVGTSFGFAVSATAGGAKLTYQWYQCEDENKTGAVKLSNRTTDLTPKGLEAGTYYYFVRITVDGLASIDSKVVCATLT